MSVYQPPSKSVSIFNSADFNYQSGNVTLSTSDSRYVNATDDSDQYLTLKSNNATLLTNTTGITYTTGVTAVANDMNIATGKLYKINGTQITTGALSDFSQSSMTANTSGSVVQSLSCVYFTIGKLFVLIIPDILLFTGNSSTLSWQIPTSAFFPVTELYMVGSIANGGTAGSGRFILTVGGLITWSASSAGAVFAGTSNCTVRGHTWVYNIA